MTATPTLASTIASFPSHSKNPGPKGVEQGLGDIARGLGVAFGQQHGELMTLKASDGVARSQPRAKPPRHLAQQLIAGRMAEPVVDGFEAIEVDDQGARAAVEPLRSR